MSSASSSGVSSPPSRLRSISSGTRITLGAAGAASRLENRLAGNPAAGGLATQPAVHRRANVRELPLVNAAGRVLARDVREQQGVLARVVGRWRRRIAAVIGSEDQQVARSHCLEQVGQAPVKVLQATVEVDRVVAVPPKHVRLDEVDEDQAGVELLEQRFRLLDPFDVGLRWTGFV